MSYKKNYYLLFLFISSFLIFFGRGVQLVFWEAPFREILWDESLLKPLIQGLFKINWQDYVSSPKTNNMIFFVTKISGLVLILAAFATVLLYLEINKKKIWVFFGSLGTFVTTLIIFLEFKEKFYNSAQFIEGSIQIGSSILFMLLILKKITTVKLQFWLKFIIALTFVGHGFYALGIYPTPGKFIDMTIILLNTNESNAKSFLLVVGVLDLLILPLIFLKKSALPTLYYAIFWGLITAFARLVYYLELNDFQLKSFYMIHDTLFRLAHGLIPLTLYFLITNKTIISNENN